MKRALLVGLLIPGAAGAQGYHLRVDTRWQSVTYRGVQLDSIPVGDTVSTPGSGPVSPDGFAVRCQPGAGYCTFFRPGPVRRGGPVTTTLDATVWGLGMTGLSVRAAARAGFDFGTADVWPGTSPAIQLLEGYAEYAKARATARLGRQVVASRLGTTSFDGGSVTLRGASRRLELLGYLGWGLARGVALPVTSAALNPLDDFQPLERQVLAGAAAGWTSATLDARVEYQREVDPRARKFVSERVALDGAVRPLAGVRVAAGAEYDVAAGWWGSAEGSVSYFTPRLRGTLGVRRYRPHFDLWTIWGAFSPVPYQSVHTAVAFAAAARFEVRGRYERYRFGEADAESPLFSAKRDGWRAELGLTATPIPHWKFDGAYQREFGPGGSVAGTAGSVSYEPSARLRATLLVAALDRPLEFRFNNAAVRGYGVDAQYAASPRLRVGLSVQRYDEEHRRPDAGAFEWDQYRVSARIVMGFGDDADARGLPPAIRLLPGGRAAR